jgi:hypothetical protein
VTTRRKRTKPGQAQGAGASPVDAACSAVPASAVGRSPRERALSGDPEQTAHFRLQRLYEISKLLTRFDSAEKTVPAVIAVMGETLALRSAIFILQREGHPRAIVWQLDGERAHPLQEAKAPTIEHAHGRRLFVFPPSRVFVRDKVSPIASERSGL